MNAEVDAYIAAAAPLRRERLETLRALVHAVAPGAVEAIEWKMPVFRLGKQWVAMANQKSYLSVYLGCEARAAAVVATDPRLKGGKACVNIGDRAAVPVAALEAAVREVLLA